MNRSALGGAISWASSPLLRSFRPSFLLPGCFLLLAGVRPPAEDPAGRQGRDPGREQVPGRHHGPPERR